MRIHDPFDVTNREPTILFIQRRLFLGSLVFLWCVYQATANVVIGVKLFAVCWALSFLISRKEPRMLEILMNTLTRKKAYDAGRFRK